MAAPGPLIAHRGASVEQPENTMAAFEAARAAGCAWIELDAQVLDDFGVVIMHDHTLDRTTDGTGPVAMQDLDAIKALRTRDPQTDDPVDERVPELRDVLAYCTDTGMGLILEIKATWGVDADDAEAVVRMVPQTPAFPLLVTSFSVTALQTVGALRPDLALGLATLRPPRDPAVTKARLGLSAIHCNAAWTVGADIDAMHAAGLDVAIATINEPNEARRFLDLGADGVMTDLPRLLASG
ncbi:MAG: glycerophosphodiester phosphodiesterase family protein [Pseudomonadota bacterium]